MTLVIFFVPDPAKAVAEMVRVVGPGGTVAAYAWDMMRGGSPTQPLWEALRAMGIKQMLPPSPEASRMKISAISGPMRDWKLLKPERLPSRGHFQTSTTSGRPLHPRHRH